MTLKIPGRMPGRWRTRNIAAGAILIWVSFSVLRAIDSMAKGVALNRTIMEQYGMYKGRIVQSLPSLRGNVTYRQFMDGINSAQAVNENETPSYGEEDAPLADNPTTHAQNKTLGFEKIYYMSLPTRRDRSDNMELIASLTNISLTHIPGVTNADVSEKENPKYLDHIGIWRASVDIWKGMLRDDVETALILEDDTDWDYHIHDIFEDLSRAMRKKGPEGNPMRITNWTEHEWRTAPYGLDWDFMWLGHCLFNSRPVRGAGEPELKNLTYFYPDRNMPPDDVLRGQRFNWAPDPRTQIEAGLKLAGRDNTWKESQQVALNGSGQWGPYVESDPFTHIPLPRMLVPLNFAVCAWGYAITKKGAQKLMYHLAMKDWIREPIDIVFGNIAESGELQGYTAVPPIIHDWKVGGVQDSDNDGVERSGPAKNVPWNDGNDPGLRMSVRTYLSSILNSEERKENKDKPKPLNHWEKLVAAQRTKHPEMVAQWDKESEATRQAKKAEEEQKKKDEEQKKKAEEEQKKIIEEQQKQKAEEAKRRAEEEKRRGAEQDKKAEEDKNAKERQEQDKKRLENIHQEKQPADGALEDKAKRLEEENKRLQEQLQRLKTS